MVCDWSFALIGNGRDRRRIYFSDTQYV
jgi:hypothetical protein